MGREHSLVEGLPVGSVGVEVKTTQSTVSTHQVSGFHQIERGESHGGVPETDLFLLSLGIEWLEGGAGGTSLPDLVDSLLAVTPGHDAQKDFLLVSSSTAVTSRSGTTTDVTGPRDGTPVASTFASSACTTWQTIASTCSRARTSTV